MYAPRLLSPLVAAITLMFSCAVVSDDANAVTLTNWKIFSGGSGSIDGSITIENGDTGEVDFSFSINDGVDGPSITRISFENSFDNTFDDGRIKDEQGVDFSESSLGITGAGDLDPPPWAGTFYQVSASGIDDGIRQDGDLLVLALALDTGTSLTQQQLEALAEMIKNQTYRIVAHVQDCVGGDSCSAIANPIPGAVWLFGSALLGLVGVGGYRSRKERTTS